MIRCFLAILLGLTLAPLQAAAPNNKGRSHFVFKEPQLRGYEIASTQASARSEGGFLKARRKDRESSEIEFSSRIGLEIFPGTELGHLLTGRPLQRVRTLQPLLFILQAPDPQTAIEQAHELSALPEVRMCMPVARRQKKLLGPYAARPNDPYFFNQWYLENRNQNGQSAGVDMNARAAWPQTRGEGVIIGFGDDGIEWTHPELQAAGAGTPHFNFSTGTTNGMAVLSSENHGTSVAGLAVAGGNNAMGISGIAPSAKFASWKLFTGGAFTATDVQTMDMFQYASNVVSIQNHSWAYGGLEQQGPSFWEHIGISNAVTFGRNGRGVVIVRAAGNERLDGGNANDDGYPSDPRTIAVAAVGFDGRAAEYSNPGACLLVAAPGGDVNFPLFTTDRQGTAGNNSATYPPGSDLANYGFDSSGAKGTSFSAPLISGLAALILSVNPDLGYRDVQQILLFSSRHFDFTDPDLKRNAVGLLKSHNVGFGVPNADLAVSLARQWVNRPALQSVSISNLTTSPIPDDGLRVVVENAPPGLEFIPASPSGGIQSDPATLSLPLVDVGMVTNTISSNLTGKGALIQRGVSFFREKIQFAAEAGAAFAIIYNNTGTFERLTMGDTDYSPIPAVFIGKTSGDALRNFLLQTNLNAKLQLLGTDYSFTVNDSLSCEHVGVRVRTDHPRRGDLRITLLSPRGTRSVLQKVNFDVLPGPEDWTYYTTHNFFENSKGTWGVTIGDEAAGSVGQVLEVELTVQGVSLLDTDTDGLSDDWEFAFFGNTNPRPEDDPDLDGYSNLLEQLLGTQPRNDLQPVTMDLSLWNQSLGRVSWNGGTNYSYQIFSGSNVTSLQWVTNVPGTFPTTEWFTPFDSPQYQFFRVNRINP